MSRPGTRVLVALGLVTASTLAFQVELTRLLSASLAYHFSFLAISLALLGTGAGALLVYLVPDWFARAPLETTLARWSAVYGLLLVGLPFVLVRLDFTQEPGGGISRGFVMNLAIACVVAALPALAAGIVVALAITGYSTWIGQVYAFDLVGAGLGALLIVPAMNWLDGPTLVVVLGLLAGLAAIGFAGRAIAARFGAAVIVVAIIGVALGATTDALFLPPRFETPPDAELVADEWNPLSRVVGYRYPSTGISAVFYDRIYAPVPKVVDDVLPTWEDLEAGPQSIGYEIAGPGRALVIGGGGGRDIYAALSLDQEPVDVIELNRGIRDVVDGELAEDSGRPYSREGVTTSIGDGRAMLAARDTEYDSIHIGFTDTLSANSAQGFALTENNLYTLEAFDEYYDHLAPGGILNVSRLRKLVGDEALRITVLTLAALDERGVENLEDHVVVIKGRDILGEEYATTLSSLEPFTPDQLAEIDALAAERSEGLAFAPNGPYTDEWAELHEVGDWKEFCQGYELNVCPPTDDKPFFFNMQRLSQIGRTSSDGYFYSSDPYTVLMITLAILFVLTAIAYVLPLLIIRGPRRPTSTSLVYFAAIGLGFLLLEIVLIQRLVLFLGFPTYALSIVLFSLLVFTGVGSQLSTRFRSARRALLVDLGLAVALIAISAFAFQPLLRSLIDLPFAARVTVAVAMQAPFGILLGMALPIGIGRFRELFPNSVAYAWGVNGIVSVLGSVLGVAIGINFGFRTATLVAAGCYAVAFLHAWQGRWPTTETVQADPEPVTTAAVAGG